MDKREREQIDILAKANVNWTHEQIAVEINRSPQVVGNYMKSPGTYGTKKSSGS